jgi:hypothetical protein
MHLEENYQQVSNDKSPKFRLGFSQKPILVLDLDETLVNVCTYEDIEILDEAYFSNLVEIEHGGMRLFLAFRPYLGEFLQSVAQFYDVIVYSHAHYEYVMKVLDIIDPEGLLILKERTFRAPEEISKSTTKNLYNLGFSEEEVARTIIIDDSRFVWGVHAGKVIPSKKFMPLLTESSERKLYKFDLFKEIYSETIYSEQNKPALEQFYAERTLEPANNQLIYLEKFLIELLQESQTGIGVGIIPSLEAIYNRKSGRIMNKAKVAIVAGKAKKAFFVNLAKMMGAAVVDKAAAEYLLVDSMDESVDLMVNCDEVCHEVKVLSAYWLTECYFLMSRAPEENFLM